MSTQLIVTACVVVYLLGIPVTAYVIGRFSGRVLAGLSMLWPIMLPFALVIGPAMWAASLGERHGRVKRMARG